MNYRCPVPNCNHFCNYLTKYHCETVHNMTKEEVIKKYGKPIKNEKSIDNNSNIYREIVNSSPILHNSSFISII